MPPANIALFLVSLVVAFGSFSNGQHVAQGPRRGHDLPHGHLISNNTIAGEDRGCQFTAPIHVTPVVTFPMCVGKTHQDLKNGMSIINLIRSRGYLPTCRVMQLLLWMASEVAHSKSIARDFFVDIGANIGSCTVHMASLGFPVVSVEPVQQHVDTIQGSITINPSFRIDLQHIGLSSSDRSIKANFGHGARNWGASEFHEVGLNETFETTLRLKTLDQVIGGKRVGLLKIDCEGCEWEALKGGRRALRGRVAIIKIELVQPSYSAGNETVSPAAILAYLENSGFELFLDVWAENKLYFGNHGNEILDLDRMFGSSKFKLGTDISVLHDSAKKIIQNPLNSTTFRRQEFLNLGSDVIAVEKSLAAKMRRKWL